MDGWMDGWMIFDYMFFSAEFQSNQDSGRVIIIGCVQWNAIYG